MTIKFYNSLTNQKEDFVPINEGEVGMYVCGMTVYDNCHLGHARAMMAFDILARYLRYQNYKVNWLIDKGHAYHSESGDVFFAVRTFPEYGKLSNKNIDDLNPGARIKEDDSKKDPLDFVLWKSAKPNEPSWDSPWGLGRPGWHIECSVMSLENLGEHFDIHGGGPDLLFPHHENEIAQSECASDHKFANYWMHSGLLKINGEKMSKSLGNFAMLKDLYNSYHPEVIRYYLISSHYRSSLNFDNESLDQARSALTRLYQALLLAPSEETDLHDESISEFIKSMNDDLNTPEALSTLFGLAKLINNSQNVQEQSMYSSTMKELGQVLGLLHENSDAFLQYGASLSDNEIEAQIQQRNEARKANDFQKADQIRDDLAEQGILLDDSTEGTTWKKS